MKNNSNQSSRTIIHDFFDKTNESKGVSGKAWLKQHQEAWMALHQMKKIAVPKYARDFLENRVRQENVARKKLHLKQNIHVTSKDIVNYLRHSCDDYYQHIRKCRGNDPLDATYRLYKWYILSVIGQHYPYVYEETIRQKHKLVETNDQYDWLEEAMLQFMFKRKEIIVSIPPARAQTLDWQNPIDTRLQNLNPEPDHPQMGPGH